MSVLLLRRYIRKPFKTKKQLPAIPTPKDVSEIVRYAVLEQEYCNSIQITGGSTFDSVRESRIILEYLGTINSSVGRETIKGEILLYITPPTRPSIVDEYFKLGADRIACSIEIWDEKLAEIITPGKYKFTGRKRHLEVLEYISEKFGSNKVFCNFVIL